MSYLQHSYINSNHGHDRACYEQDHSGQPALKILLCEASGLRYYSEPDRRQHQRDQQQCGTATLKICRRRLALQVGGCQRNLEQPEGKHAEKRLPAPVDQNYCYDSEYHYN